MRTTVVAATLLSAALSGPASSLAQSPAEDPWASLRVLAGAWKGTAAGRAGEGTVARQYEFVMRGRFLHERNVSTYPVQERNPKGEVHEHWSVFSFDRARKRIVLRQFHVEGFVNQFALDPGKSGPTRLVFESEGFENFYNRWRARETYEIAGPDAFTETFELAPPDKPFEVYSVNRFVRAMP